MSVVFTIGYEGSDIPRFLRVLKAAGVDTLVDVRAVPISRKKGFSKSALRAHLGEANIEYVHFSALGNPKAGREAAWSGDFCRFRSIYNAHLRTKIARSAFEEIIQLAVDRAVCLMCFERDVKTCHRDIITDEMEIRGFDCIDLLGDDPESYVRNADNLPGRRFGQGLAAAEQ